MNNTKSMTVAALAATLVAGCSASGTSPQNVTTVNPANSVFHMAVGTANIYGDLAAAGGGNLVGFNVIATLRQPSGAQTPGDSGALVNTPTLSGPFTLPGYVGTPDNFGSTIATGPTSAEVGGNRVTSTPQQNAGTPASSLPPSSFGVSGGVSGLGLEPFNYSATGSAGGFGVPATYVPYAVPLYDALPSGTDANSFTPWGGPPAFDPNKDGKGTRDNSGFPTGVKGLSEGLDVFANTIPAVGTYTLSTVIPTSTSNSTLTTTANLASVALLPAVVAPAPVFDGTGGAAFAVTLPPGVTEGYVEIIDFGPPQPPAGSPALVSCNGSDAAPVYYTIFVTASGTATLPPGDGPGNPGTTTPSLCTAAQNTTANAGTATLSDQFTVSLVGFDYPAYEAAYPNSNGNPAPVLAGANGQADITISSAGAFGGITTGSVARRIPVQTLLRSLRHKH